MYTGCTVSRSLADLLAPILGDTSHHIKTSNHLANEMASIMIEQDDVFLSHDVVSLFTNTPINETLDITKKLPEDDTELKLLTNLNVDDIMELLKFIVTTTCICFRGNIYKLNFNLTMGSPVSPVSAHRFKDWLEQQAILIRQ